MSQGAHFTIDFIEHQYRQPVQMLMEILCIDMKAAYQLFLEAGCNTEAAINLKTTPPPENNHFQDTVPRNTRGRGGQRNQPIHNYHEELNHFYENFDDEEDFDADYHSLPVARRRPPPMQVQEETQFDIKFNKLLQQNRKKKKHNFESEYPIRRQITAQHESMSDSRSIGMKIFGKKSTKPEEKKILNIRPFYKQLEKGLIEKMIHIKFGKGSMSESLQQCLRMFQPLLAFHLNFDRQQNSNTNTNTRNSKNQIKKKKMVIEITEEDDPNQKLIDVNNIEKSNERAFLKTQKNKFLKSLLTNKKFQNTANDSFLNYILDVDNYDFEHYFKEYFQKSTRNQSYLVVLRVNYLEKLEFLGKIQLDEVIQRVKQKDEKSVEQQIASIAQQLKKLGEKHKSIQTEQDNLFERYRLYKLGIYHYQYKKPPSTAEKIKIKQDRQIIKQQQEEFMNMHNQYIQQKIRQLGNQKPEKQKISKEDIMQKRKAVREGLKTYKQGDQNLMMVKFRLPSGKNIVLQVSAREKVSYLFDYIFSHEMDDLGFEQEEEGGYCEREFDIIRPEDRTSLQNRMDILLDDLFEGSLMESLIVKEKN